MEKRERLIRTFNFEPTDRPPLDIMENNIWKTLFSEFSQKYGFKTQDDILDHLDCDTRWLFAGKPEELKLLGTDADAIDVAGNFGGDQRRLLEDVETPEEVTALFCPNVDEIEYPDFRYEREKYPNHALVFAPVWMPIFSGACESFGMEEAMVKMITEPEVFEEYCRIQSEFAIKVFEKGFSLGASKYCDFVWIGDDFCDSRGPMISPQMWRSMIKPYLAKVVSFLKNEGMRVLFHSCGAVSEFIEDFIELGVDGLLVVQTSAKGMQVRDLAQQYGGRIVFWGAIDAQQLLTMGTPEQVYNEVLENCCAFQSCGGYVVANSHHSMPDIHRDNIEAMCRAVHEVKKD